MVAGYRVSLPYYFVAAAVVPVPSQAVHERVEEQRLQ
jgi:hypothetical protein